MLKSSRDKCPK